MIASIVSSKCAKCLVECWFYYDEPGKCWSYHDEPGKLYDDLVRTIHICKIDPGAEFSAPKSNKTQDVIDWIRKNPDCTLKSGEGKLLLDEIDRLKDELSHYNASATYGI